MYIIYKMEQKTEVWDNFPVLYKGLKSRVKTDN
jgi:hypothetical protein